MQAVCAKCSRLMCRAVVLFLVAECAQTTPMIAPLPGDPNFSIDGSVAFFKSGESNPTQPNPTTPAARSPHRACRPEGTPHATVEGTPPGTPYRHPHNPKPSRGEPGPDRPTPSTPDGARDRGKTRGGAQTTWNGRTRAQCGDRARCARHTTQEGGERTPREQEHRHT